MRRLQLLMDLRAEASRPQCLPPHLNNAQRFNLFYVVLRVQGLDPKPKPTIWTLTGMWAGPGYSFGITPAFP